MSVILPLSTELTFTRQRLASLPVVLLVSLSCLQCVTWADHCHQLNHITYIESSLLWPPCVADADIIFLPCGFFLLSIFYHFCSSPNLSGRRLDVYHTSIHGVALVRMYNAGLKCAVCGRCKCRTQKSRQKSPSGHQRTTLSGYIFTNKARIDNRKKLLSSNIFSTRPHNMVNFGPL